MRRTINRTTSCAPLPWTGYACALLATAIWSGNFIVARGLAQDIPPVSLAFFRWLTATAVILPFAFRGLVRQRRLIGTRLGHLVPTAFLGVTLFNTLVYMAGHSTTALNLSLIAVFSPVFIIVLARVLFAEPITPRRCLGVLLAVSGITALTSGGDPSRLAGLGLNPGDGVMLFATLVFAAYTILVRRKPPDLTPVTYLAGVFLAGLLMLTPWALWEWVAVRPGLPPVHTVGAILYVGIGASLAAFLLWNRAIASIGPTRAGLVYYSLPAFCGLEAWLILGEPVTWVHAAAGLLIVSGILIATHGR